MIRNYLVEFEVQTYIDLEPEQQNRPQHLLQRPEDLFHMLIWQSQHERQKISAKTDQGRDSNDGKLTADDSNFPWLEGVIKWCNHEENPCITNKVGHI